MHAAGYQTVQAPRPACILQSFAVTPHDTNMLTTPTGLDNGITVAIKVAVAGNVAVTYANDVEAVEFLVAGVWHPMEVKRIKSTGTTATGISAGYGRI